MALLPAETKQHLRHVWLLFCSSPSPTLYHLLLRECGFYLRLVFKMNTLPDIHVLVFSLR